MAEIPSLGALSVELIDLIVDHIPWSHHRTSATTPFPTIPRSECIPRNLRNNTLRALCLSSRRLNAICTPHLYRRFEDKTEGRNENGAISTGYPLLLLLRTIIRNPDRGQLVRHVVASTWHTLDTRALTEEDMKMVFEQAGMITTNYPLRITDRHGNGSVYLGPPPHSDTSQGVEQEHPSLLDGFEMMSDGRPAPFDGFISTEVNEFRSHPQFDFPICSAASWCHAIRVGEWDAIFTLLLSYLPNMETLSIHNPDAGERCPFAQCIYLTSFMERVSISQQMEVTPRDIKRLQINERRLPPVSQELASLDHQQESLGALGRKRAHSDTTLALPCAKRQRMYKSTSMPHALPGTQGIVSKRQWLFEYFKKYSLRPTMDRSPQQWQPLLSRFRSMIVDCIYRSSDVHMADVMPFIRPKSVEEFHCGYLCGSWPGDTKFNLKSLTIKHGHLDADTLASFINCCTQLKRLSFETAGSTQIRYQSLATPGVMAALQTVAGTLEHLDLMKADMNYWHPALDVSHLHSYTAYTFRSFAAFGRLKRLYLKAESMIRRSEADPDNDTGSLWAKLPPSLEYLHLAGNKKWFGNLIPQIQELVAVKAADGTVLPGLKKVVMEFREVEQHRSEVEFGGNMMLLTSCRDRSDITVIRFGKADLGMVRRDLRRLLKGVLETAPLPW